MQLEHLMEDLKKSHGYTSDTEITAEELEDLCGRFKVRVHEVIGKEFPDDAPDQLWGGIGAVFQSWNGKRAISYRKIEGIPDDWGTAVTVQAMVFGNMGDDCATGVAFTRNPGTGENAFYGEWLVNAQGEDVVAGIRTPNALNEHATNDQNRNLPTLEKTMPGLYKELVGYPQQAREALPRHAGPRVHHPGRTALHAPDPRRQAQRPRGAAHGRRYGARAVSSTRRPRSRASGRASSTNCCTR